MIGPTMVRRIARGTGFRHEVGRRYALRQG